MWRNTALRAEILPGLDGRVAIGLLVFAVHWSWWTFGVFAATCVFFWIIARRGYSMRTAWMRVRRMMIGDTRGKWTAQEYCRRALPGDPRII